MDHPTPPTPPPSGDLNAGDVNAGRDANITYNVYPQHPAPNTQHPTPQHPEPRTQNPPFVGVPALPTHALVGRDEQLAALRTRLVSGSSLSLTALEGMGGVGKTTLAALLAHDEAVRRHFGDGVLWASLGKTPDLLGTLAAWGEALGRDVTGYVSAGERCQALRDAIGQRRMLLVVDDVWSTEAAEGLRCGGPACAHLLTTRQRDVARAFAGQAEVETVPTLDESEAWALLQKLAPDACAADPDAARALARAVGGLPLALTLLGGYLSNEEASLFPDLAAGALAEMHDPARRLRLASERLGSRKGEKVQLGAVIALSLNDLPGEVRRAFHALGAFAPKPATFDRTAAEAVTESDAQTLARFVKRNLLEWDGAVFALHQVLHDFATYAPDPAATERHHAHYLALVNADREDWRRIEAAYPQLQWAWAHLHDDAVLAYVWAVGHHQNRRGLWRDYITWATRGLTVAQQQGQPKDEGTLLNNLGRLYDSLGQRREALGYYERALPIMEDVGDRAGLAVTLTNIGAVYSQLGQLHKALGYFERALPISEEMGDRTGLVVTLTNIGLVYDNLGQRREALGYYERALPICEEVGDRAGLAATLNNIGAVYDNLGQRREALGYFERALPIMEDVGDRAGLAVTLNNIGMVYRQLGQLHEALGYYERALPIQEEVGDRAGLAVTLTNIGAVYDNLRQRREALGYFERALPICEEVGDRAGLAVTLTNIGAVYDNLGQRREALGYFERALPICEEVGDRHQESTTRYNLAMLHRAEGRLAEAVAQLRRVVELDEQVEHPDLESDRAALARVEAELKAEGEKGRRGEGETRQQQQPGKKRPWWRFW